MKHDTPHDAIAKAVFEALEDRRLMSTVSFEDGVLHLVGDTDTANKMTVRLTGSGKVVGSVGGESHWVRLSELSQIKITGGDGDDSIYVDASLNTPVVVYAGEGDDKVFGGAGNDSVYGGSGNDFIDVRGGDNLVLGESGNDRIYAGDGNDHVEAGADNDTVLAGAGNDWVGGGGGTDLLDGKEGNDTLLAGSGNDKVYGGEGEDVLDGNEGADLLDGGAGRDSFLGLESQDTTDSDADDLGSGDNTDTTTGGGGGDTTTGGTGGDTTAGGGGTDTTTSGSGDDTTGGTDDPADNTGEPGAPQPVIRLIDSIITQGQAIHVHGTETVLSNGSAATAKYEWDFGDPNGSYNTLAGYNAAHVYRHAGTYTITLRVTDSSGLVATQTTTVQVKADARPIVYVSSSGGNDANDGKSAGSAVKSWERAKQLLGSNSNLRVLFKRGDTFSVDESLTIYGTDVTFGSYGDGTRPVLMWTGLRDGNRFIGMGGNARRIVIENLTFDSIYNGDIDQSGMPIALKTAGVNITSRNNQFLNVWFALNNNAKPQGVLAQDNDAPLKTGIRAYFSWMEGSDFVYLGNTVANSTREHIIRGADYQRVLIAHNDLTNTRADSTDTNKGCVVLQKGSWAWVDGNTINEGGIGAGPLGDGDGLKDPNYQTVRTSWVVIQNNVVNGSSIYLHHGAEHVMIRNNAITRHGAAGITIEGWNGTYSRGITDVYVLDNTGVNNDIHGNFLKLLNHTDGVTMKRNLYVSPNLVTGEHNSAVIYVEESNLSSFRVISDNIWSAPSAKSYADGGYNYVYSYWANSAGYLTPDEWNAYAVVGDDVFQDVTLTVSYRATVGDTTAGASLKLAA